MRETSIEQIAGIIGARAEALTTVVGRHSDWQPAPPPDPDFLRRLKRLRWEKAAVLVGLILGWALLLAMLFTVHGMSFLGGFAAFLGSGTGVIWMRTRSRRAAPHVADLLDLPASFPQFPVELDYLASDCPYGRDEGIMSFADGWMHFQGRRTSWSLRSPDVQVSPAVPANGFTKGMPPVARLTWMTRSRYYAVRVMPMDSVEGLGGGLRRGFETELRRWAAIKSLPAGSCILPPTEMMPGKLERAASAAQTAHFIGRLAAASLVVVLVAALEHGWLDDWVALFLVMTALWLITAVVGGSFKRGLTGLMKSLPSDFERRLVRRPASWSARFWHRIRSWRLAARARRPRFAEEGVPVELRFEIQGAEYRREVGWLSVHPNRLMFQGEESSWTLGSDQATHRDPREETWRSYFEEPIPLDQILDIGVGSSRVRMIPVDIPGHSGAAVRLARILREFDASENSNSKTSVLPSWTPQLRIVRKLERSFGIWSVVRVPAFVTFVGGIALAIMLAISASTDLIWVVVSAAAAMVGLVVAIFAGGNRRLAAKHLDTIRQVCVGGSEMVRFRGNRGPWWMRVNPPPNFRDDSFKLRL